jgi:hypothetical protein
MKVFTRNEFSTKQRTMLGLMATMPIESDMDRRAIMAYWTALVHAMAEQLTDLGGEWNEKDLVLIQCVSRRLDDTAGIDQSIRKGTIFALMQVAEIHPALGEINPEFLE